MFTVTTTQNEINGTQQSGFNIFVSLQTVMALQDTFLKNARQSTQLEQKQEETKRCPRCKTIKAHCDYYLLTDGKPSCYCKECHKEYNRNRYLEKKERK